jgi:hypothetical protein
LPDDFQVTTGDINKIRGWGIFGGKRLTALVETNFRTIKIAG